MNRVHVRSLLLVKIFVGGHCRCTTAFVVLDYTSIPAASRSVFVHGHPSPHLLSVLKETLNM